MADAIPDQLQFQIRNQKRNIRIQDLNINKEKESKQKSQITYHFLLATGKTGSRYGTLSGLTLDGMAHGMGNITITPLVQLEIPRSRGGSNSRYGMRLGGFIPCTGYQH